MSNPFAPPGTVDEARPADDYVSTSWYGDVRETVRLWIEAWPVLLAWAPILVILSAGRVLAGAASGPLGLLYGATIMSMASYGAAISAVLWHHRRLSGQEGVFVALREGASRGPWAYVAWLVPGILISLGALILVVPGVVVASEYGLLTVVIACEDGGGALAARRSANRRGRIASLGAFFALLSATLAFLVAFLAAYGFRAVVAGLSPSLVTVLLVTEGVAAILRASITLSMYVVWREAYRDQSARPVS